MAFSWLCKTLRSQYRWCGISGGGALIGWPGFRVSPSHTYIISIVFFCDLCTHVVVAELSTIRLFETASKNELDWHALVNCVRSPFPLL